MIDDKFIVISLGGALIIPDQIDVVFLKIFTDTIKDYVKQGYRFIIITGGGKLCRNFNETAIELNNPTKYDLDWLGIATTRLNALLIRIAFGDYAHETIIMDPEDIPQTKRPILVGGGWKPGNSSDLAAIYCANGANTNKVINLSNIDFVYDKDPRKFSDAIPIKNITWKDFRKLIPTNWQPGLSSPFDPIAALKAESMSLEVVIMNGKNIENLRNYLDGNDFIGTIIK